jgi:hypothetical protein
VSVDNLGSNLTLASALLGVDSSGDHIYFSNGSSTYHVRDTSGLTSAPMPAEAGFITRPGTSLVINSAIQHDPVADTDAFIDAYLYDIAGDSWTLISDGALVPGLPVGIDIAANSASTDLNFVNLTYDDGHPASVVVNRSGARSAMRDPRPPSFGPRRRSPRGCARLPGRPAGGVLGRADVDRARHQSDRDRHRSRIGERHDVLLRCRGLSTATWCPREVSNA